MVPSDENETGHSKVFFFFPKILLTFPLLFVMMRGRRGDVVSFRAEFKTTPTFSRKYLSAKPELVVVNSVIPT